MVQITQCSRVRTADSCSASHILAFDIVIFNTVCTNICNSTLFTARLIQEENLALLDYYAVSSDSFLPTFRVNLSVTFSRFKNPNESL
jgi:hypothetical protein